jgi:hypothetical protein
LSSIPVVTSALPATVAAGAEVTILGTGFGDDEVSRKRGGGREREREREREN